MDDQRGTASSSSRPFLLREWRVEPALNRISRGDTTHQVEPRVMDVLVCLASRPGDVFSRDELLQAVWRDTVVGEEALTRAISELRRMLDDDPKSPRYVETIRKGGYRLVAAVGPVALPAEAASGDTAPPAAPRRSLGLVAIIGALAVVVAIAVWLLFLRTPSGGQGGGAPQLATTPLTSLQGTEEFPAISRDGGFVAFAWAGEAGDNVDVYLKQIGVEEPKRLTDDPGADTFPRWSADGKTLAFLHIDQRGQALYTIPQIGGQPRLLVQAGGWLGGHDFSPDGRFLVFSEAASQIDPARLFVLDLQTQQRRRLAPTSDEGVADVGPVYSPDGRTVAFMRANAARLFDVYLVDVESGEERRLTRGLLQTRGIDWARDGRSLICSAVSSAYYGLLRIDVEDGSISRIPTRGQWIHFPTVARDADRMVYQDISFEKNIWRVQRHADPALGLSTDPVIATTRWDCEACYSPDGSRIAYTSAGSGSLEVWTAAADGSRPLQLTDFDGLNVGNPRWSPDGTRVAFHAAGEGLPELWVVGADGGRPERLTADGTNHLLASWSRDGEWLYYGSDRGGAWELWKLRVDDPAGSPRQVTRGGGINGFESADGKVLYFARTDQAGLWRQPTGELPVEAVPELFLEDLPTPGGWGNWWLSDSGIALSRSAEGGPMIVFYDFGTGQMEDVTQVPNIAVPSLSVSPDGLAFLYARIESRASDIMLVEDFK